MSPYTASGATFLTAAPAPARPPEPTAPTVAAPASATATSAPSGGPAVASAAERAAAPPVDAALSVRHAALEPSPLHMTTHSPERNTVSVRDLPCVSQTRRLRRLRLPHAVPVAPAADPAAVRSASGRPVAAHAAASESSAHVAAAHAAAACPAVGTAMF